MLHVVHVWKAALIACRMALYNFDSISPCVCLSGNEQEEWPRCTHTHLPEFCYFTSGSERRGSLSFQSDARSLLIVAVDFLANVQVNRQQRGGGKLYLLTFFFLLPRAWPTVPECGWLDLFASDSHSILPLSILLCYILYTVYM